MRKLAPQIPSAVSRLYAANLVKTPPTWYLPVINNPPSTLPPRQSVRRTPHSNPFKSDLPPSHVDKTHEGLTKTHKMKHMRASKPRPSPIVYAEDRVRRQFFKDFPFEALRPTTLAEGQEVREQSGVSGKEWTSLAQRGDYPSPEDVVEFTLSIHRHHQRPLSEAYTIATAEFSHLRAAHEMATIAAEMEASAHGAVFSRSPFDRSFKLERRALDTLAAKSTGTNGTSTKPKFRKPQRWTATTPQLPDSEFSGGTAYVEQWRIPPPLDLGAGEGDLLPRAADLVEEKLTEKVEEKMDDLELLKQKTQPLEGKR